MFKNSCVVYTKNVHIYIGSFVEVAHRGPFEEVKVDIILLYIQHIKIRIVTEVKKYYNI